MLKTSCIFAVPIQNYINDFAFIVNGVEFKTSRLISNLLSPIICHIHLTDPTFDVFNIKTHHQGNFSHILSLVNFKQINIQESELPFISEVFEILGIQSIEYINNSKTIDIEIDNVFTLLNEHEKVPYFYSNRISEEIDFISLIFSEIYAKKEKELLNVSIDTLLKILNNEKLQLEQEDHLIQFINKLYSKNHEYSILYETVLFENVSPKAINEFISIYDINNISKSIWNRITKRLQFEPYKIESNRYKGMKIDPPNDDKFKGIINYIINNEQNKIKVTASSINGSNFEPQNVI